MRLRLMLMVLGLAVAAPECSNPYIDHFRRMVTIYQSPVAIDNVCGGEWKMFGSCCELKAVEDYARKDKAMIEEAVNRVVKTIQTTAQQIKRLHEKPRSNSKKSKAESKSSSTIFSHKVRESESTILQILLDSQKMKSDLNQCWLHMAQFRSNSLCNACSGRSQNFFSQSQKGIISQFTCNSIISNCIGSFSTIMRLLASLDSMKESMNRHFREWQLDLRAKLHRDCKDKNRIFADQIQEIVKALHDWQNPAERGKKSKFICEKLVNFERKTFIQRVEVVLQNYADLYVRFKRTISCKKSRSRRVLTNNNFDLASMK